MGPSSTNVVPMVHGTRPTTKTKYVCIFAEQRALTTDPSTFVQIISGLYTRYTQKESPQIICVTRNNKRHLQNTVEDSLQVMVANE